MSLFGGEIDSRQPSPPENNFPVAETLSDDDADAEKLPTPLPESQSSSVISEDDADADDEDEDGEEDDQAKDDTKLPEAPDRPNRWQGKALTWRRYTAAERRIADALEQSQNGDLAAHLYNAHALKRRVRRPAEDLAGVKNWHSKDSWLKSGDELDFVGLEGELQTELVPSKRWTAWPLPPKELPASWERFGSKNMGAEGIDAVESTLPGYEMREELLATFLRLAKEKWRSRVPKTEHDHTRGHASVPPEDGRSDTEMEDAMSTKADVDEATTPQTAVEQHNRFTTKERKRQLRRAVADAVLLADDDKARDLLYPSINSLLSRVDELAAALRRSRLNHFGRGSESDTSGSEMTTDVDRRRSTSRAAPRPRRMSARLSASRAASRPNSPVKAPPAPDYNHDSDSASDFGAELESRTGLPSDSGSSTAATTRLKRKRSASADRLPFAESGQVGLMDWSEVLGTAAMLGWPPAALARTAQRCAALFNESMSFRPLDEALATAPAQDPIHYTPTTIPAPDILGPPRDPPKRPYFEPGTLRCPHADCPLHERDSQLAYRIIEHVVRSHGYDPRTNDSDNEERTLGAVHRDGFAMPITLKQGWLGNRRRKVEGG